MPKSASIDADRQQQLSIDEQVRDFVVEALVAQHLADGFVNGGLALAGLLVGALALDDHQRDAVDEQDNIRAAGLMAAAPFDR